MAVIAPQPINPFEAAKRLRVVARSLRDQVVGDAPGGNTLVLPLEYKDTADAMKMYRDAELDRRLLINARLEAVRIAARTRRASETNRAMANLEDAIRRHNRAIDSVWSCSDGLRTAVLVAAKAVRIPKGKGMLQDLANEINVLAQQFPTVDEMPHTSAENVLRAIIAVLRNSGEAGSADLNWKEVLGYGKKKVDNGSAAAEAAPVANAV